jgi:hypothetical protein
MRLDSNRAGRTLFISFHSPKLPVSQPLDQSPDVLLDLLLPFAVCRCLKLEATYFADIARKVTALKEPGPKLVEGPRLA